MMRKWRSWVRVLWPARPELTAKEATEEALRVYPRCC